jgi:uncharacterized membrane protein (DUF485 family)
MHDRGGAVILSALVNHLSNSCKEYAMNRNARLGLRFFAIYAAVYLGFVLLNAFAPETMDQTPLAGINLAVISGLGLIVFALVLSLIYGLMCALDDQDDRADRSARP